MTTLKTQRNAERPEALFEFTNGIVVDRHLAAAEIRVQTAWVNALVAANLLSADDSKTAKNLFQKALQQIQADEFDWQIADEDIHMNLERFVTENAGDLGKRIHYGRSRNDLIATTLRLFTANVNQEIHNKISNVVKTLIQQAEQNLDLFVPGMTHLQHGQPIRLAQILLAHAQAFARDTKRLQQAQNLCLSHMPLGAAAFAGTTLDLDFQKIANELNFENVCENGYDAVGDRDFILETLNAFSLLAVHLARLCEDVLYYSSTAVGLFKLPPNWSTGSSIMPNKRNPDVPELSRAKCARIISLANEGANLVKCVNTSYGSDLHELKTTLITSYSELNACLTVWPHFLKEMTFDSERAKALLNTGHILATEMANAAVENGTPFRDAYKTMAELVEKADQKNKQVHEISKDHFEFEQAVEARAFPGGTAFDQITKQIQNLKSQFSF